MTISVTWLLTALLSGIVARPQFFLHSFLFRLCLLRQNLRLRKVRAATATKKQSHGAAKRAQAPADLQQELGGTEEELTSDEALTDTLQGMANSLYSMMTMSLELSLYVHGLDDAAAV